MDNMSNKDWYQILIDNPELTTDDLIQEFKKDSFLNMLVNDEDIKILAKTNPKKIHKQLDKLDEPKEIKMLMKKIFS